jgi:hypothetical protein
MRIHGRLTPAARRSDRAGRRGGRADPTARCPLPVARCPLPTDPRPLHFSISRAKGSRRHQTGPYDAPASAPRPGDAGSRRRACKAAVGPFFPIALRGQPDPAVGTAWVVGRASKPARDAASDNSASSANGVGAVVPAAVRRARSGRPISAPDPAKHRPWRELSNPARGYVERRAEFGARRARRDRALRAAGALRSNRPADAGPLAGVIGRPLGGPCRGDFERPWGQATTR